MKKIKKMLLTICSMFMFVSMFSFPVKADSSYDTVTLKGKYLYQSSKEFINTLNTARQKKGIPKLKVNEILLEGSMKRASEYYVNGDVSIRPNGKNTLTLYNGVYVGGCYLLGWAGNDNGEANAERVIETESYLMDASYNSIGVGAFDLGNNGVYWYLFACSEKLKGIDTFPSNKSKTVNIEVKKAALSYKLEDNSPWVIDQTKLDAGSSLQYTVEGTYSCENGFQNEFKFLPTQFKWSSSDNNIARIDQNGYLYGIKKGTVTITAKGYDKTIKLKVKVLGDNKISYVKNGGTLHKYSPKSYVSTADLYPAKKENYLFKGWYMDSDLKERVKRIDRNFGDINLYAKWWKVKVEDTSKPSVKITSSSKKLLVRIPKVNKADGYQVYYSTNKDFRNAKKAIVEKNSYVSPKVTVGKTYYVKVRAFRFDSTGKRIYGKFSNVVKLKAE